MKILFLIFLFFSILSSAEQSPTSETCDGYPKYNVKTAPGFCLGVVYDDSLFSKNEIKKLRWAAQVSNNLLIITDLTDWGSFNGKIYSLEFKKDNAPLNTLFSKETFTDNPTDSRREIINRPNQITRGPDNKVYVGTSTAILRFDPLLPSPKDSIETLISGLPEGGLHSLKAFTFDNKGNIYVNIGSESNVCQNYTKFADTNPNSNPNNFKQKQYDYCPEVENNEVGHAQIRKYKKMQDGSYSKDFEIFSRGLRNSLALIWDPSNQSLYQGENGRDAISKFSNKYSNSAYPNDELNILKTGKHYGWPYCFGNNKNSPEWENIDCQKYQKPQLLLPPHSAPLGFLIYKGTMFPRWYRGRLLATLHGYEAGGHRIITFKKDTQGHPNKTPLSLVYEWEQKTNQGKGKPVGITELSDGSVIIIEDEPENKVLRLFYDPKNGNGKPIQEINKEKPLDDLLSPAQEEIRKLRMNQKTFDGNIPPFTKFEIQVIDNVCYSCHQIAGAPGVRLLRYDDEGNEKRILDSGKSHILLDVIKGTVGAPSMPPFGWTNANEQEAAVKMLEDWLNSIKH
jgi:glucose/arabinose dehydrogenase/cytochrome c5